MYLYRAVDSQGNSLEFLLSSIRNAQAAKRFFAKVLAAAHTSAPRVITVLKCGLSKSIQGIESGENGAKHLRTAAEQVS
jgi:transposase-like protein